MYDVIIRQRINVYTIILRVLGNVHNIIYLNIIMMLLFAQKKFKLIRIFSMRIPSEFFMRFITRYKNIEDMVLKY